MMDVLAASLLAVCLSEVNGDIHHQRGHDDYYFRDYFCSAENLGVDLDCGKIRELLELEKLVQPFILPTEIKEILIEVYQVCCTEV